MLSEAKHLVEILRSLSATSEWQAANAGFLWQRL